jgi:hypothetical protein
MMELRLSNLAGIDMIRYSLAGLAVFLLSFRVVGQCVVSKDDKGRTITTCQVYYRENGGMLTGNHVQVVYLGSEYFTFPIMQEGSVQLGGKEIPCRLAYSVAGNEVSYQMHHVTTIKRNRPEAFTVNGHRFIRQPIVGQAKFETYFMVLSDGKTKLLKNIKSELRVGKGDNGYVKADEFQGYYNIQESYFIKRGSALPEPVKLSGKSVLSVLQDKSEQLASRLPDGKLKPEEVIEVLKYYDTLTPEVQTAPEGLANKSALNRDPLFNQVLRRLSYPGLAKAERVYGRVYVGFEIDQRGEVQNIALLSPENIGFGFDYVVKQTLKKLPVLSPEYTGKYALPVAFTLTSPKNQGTQVPVNKLSAERLENRTELDEITVPVVVPESLTARPDGREVWGYYK